MAAKTANEQWRDELIAHMIAMLSIHGTIAQNVVNILDVTEKELRDQISRRLGNIVNPSGVDPFSGRAAQRLEALADSIKDIRGAAIREGLDATTRRLRNMAVAEPVILKSNLDRVMPVIFDPVLPDPSTLRALATNKPFEGRVLRQWFAELQRADADRIMNELRIGLVQGDNISTLTRRIVGSAPFDGRDGATAASRRAAIAIVRTAAVATGAEARDEFFRANSDIFSEEAWVATLDHRACPVCMGLDGQRFKIGQGPRAPIHMQCRCLRVAVVADNGQLIGTRPFNPSTEKSLLKEFADREGLGVVSSRDGLPHGTKGAFDEFARKRVRELIGRMPASQTYAAFLKNQSASFQDEVLGATRGKLFRQGDLPISQFSDMKTQKAYTMRQLALRYGDAFKKAGLNPEDFLD